MSTSDNPLGEDSKANELDELLFTETMRQPLSDCDRDIFLNLLEHPHAANETLKRAAAEHKVRRG